MFASYVVLHYISLMSRSTTIQIRLTEEEKDGFDMAADIAGIPLSSWVRERLRMAATQDLTRVGQRAPFLKPIILKQNGR